jgi:sugar phosphate isomerase/epimerase
MDRRTFLAQLSFLPAGLAHSTPRLPANRNVKWALSLGTWANLPPCPFNEILDLMQETGFMGIRLTNFDTFLERYNLTVPQLHRELSRRNLHLASISFGGPLADPAQREKVLEKARNAMRFLADFGANHLVVFPPARVNPHATPPEAMREISTTCNQIGEAASEMGFTAGLHNHLGAMVQTQEEVDRFMSITDPKLFGLSPDTAHLHLAGCQVVSTFERYKPRIRFMDYKDAKWTTPPQDWVEWNGKALPRESPEARFFASIYDLGDGEVDFPGCHRVLKEVKYRGWICVDLDTVRRGPLLSYQRSGAYIVRVLEPIYL